MRLCLWPFTFKQFCNNELALSVFWQRILVFINVISFYRNCMSLSDSLMHTYTDVYIFAPQKSSSTCQNDRMSLAINMLRDNTEIKKCKKQMKQNLRIYMKKTLLDYSVILWLGLGITLSPQDASVVSFCVHLCQMSDVWLQRNRKKDWSL